MPPTGKRKADSLTDDSGLLVSLPETLFREILSFCSATDLGRLSLTCRHAKKEAYSYAEHQARDLVSSRTHAPGKCKCCCALSIPLDWSWPGRLERLRCQDFMKGVDLFLYGHCFDTYRFRDQSIKELWECVNEYLQNNNCSEENVEVLMVESDAIMSAKMGTADGSLRLAMDGPRFAAKVSGAMPKQAKLHLCSGLVNNTGSFCDIGDVRFAIAQPLVLNTKEVLVVAPFPPAGKDENESPAPTFCIPPLDPTEPLITVQTKLVHRCWNCNDDVNGEACDSCVFDEDDDGHVTDEYKDRPFSSNPELARLMGREENKRDDKVPVTYFELLSGPPNLKESRVLGRAELSYENSDNEDGTKAGPTIDSIVTNDKTKEEVKGSGDGSTSGENVDISLKEESLAIQTKLLDAVMEWVRLVFPHPTELQVDNSVMQCQIPDGYKLFESRGWRDVSREGDYSVIIGDYHADSDEDEDDDGGDY